jgi:hydrogenase-4 component B
VLAHLVGTVPFLELKIVVDDLSAYFLLALSVLAFCVSLYSVSYLDAYAGKRNLPLFDAMYALFVLSMALVFTAGHAVFFLVAWEAMSILSYFLVVFESEREENVKAGTIYLVMTAVGTAFLLTGILTLYANTGTFELGALAALPSGARTVVFLSFLVGFGIKAGVVPLHVWLPYAHPAAPANVSALMSGIMVKTALYGLLRFVLVGLGVPDGWWGAALLVLGLVTALTGVSHAYVESDMKRLLAYSTIENVGILVTGLGVGFLALSAGRPALASLALAATLFHAFNHAMFKGALFLGVGSVHHATGTRDLEALGGLVKRMPATTVLVVGAALAASALPPTSGFASEWMTFQALFQSLLLEKSGLGLLFVLAAAALALAGALAAATFLKLLGVGFLGRARGPAAAAAHEAALPERIGGGVLVASGLVLGLVPGVALLVLARPVQGLTGVSPGAVSTGWLGLDPSSLSTSAVASGTLSPLSVAAGVAAFLLAALAAARLVGGRYLARKYGTWDCGFETVDARMQYSAMGFSKSFQIVFRFLFRPTRERRVEGEHVYHPETIAYTTTSVSLVEKYLYEPLVEFVHAFSRKAKSTIQTGSLRHYLAYILFALLGGLVYFLVA